MDALAWAAIAGFVSRKLETAYLRQTGILRTAIFLKEFYNEHPEEGSRLRSREFS